MSSQNYTPLTSEQKAAELQRRISQLDDTISKQSTRCEAYKSKLSYIKSHHSDPIQQLTLEGKLHTLEHSIQLSQQAKKNLEEKYSQLVSLPSSLQYKLSASDIISHKLYGIGVIYSIEQTNIKVYFSNGYKKSISDVHIQLSTGILCLKHRWDFHTLKYTPDIFTSSTALEIYRSKDPNDALESNFQTTRDISELQQDLYIAVKLCKNSFDGPTAQYNAKIIFRLLRKILYTTGTYDDLLSRVNNLPLEESLSDTTEVISHLDTPNPLNRVMFDHSILFSSEEHTLYVHRGIIKCIRDKHNIFCVNAHIPTIYNHFAIFNVNYCKDCDMFFISEHEYLRYLKKYKTLLAKTVTLTDPNSSNGSRNLADNSPLQLCGYTVSAENNLSDKERELILSNVISRQIMTKPAVIRLLEWFIHMNGQKPSNSLAKAKWEHDLAFVSNYDSKNQKNQQINETLPYDGYHQVMHRRSKRR